MDLSGKALGFTFSVEDHGTKTLGEIGREYKLVQGLMKSTKALAGSSTTRVSKVMSSMADSIATVKEQVVDTTAAMKELQKQQSRTQKVGSQYLQRQAKQPNNLASGEKSKKWSEVRMTPRFPRERDAHFQRTGLTQAYRNTVHPPEYTMRVPAFADGMGMVSKPTFLLAGEKQKEFILTQKQLSDMVGSEGIRQHMVEITLEEKIEKMSTKYPKRLERMFGENGFLNQGIDNWENLDDAQKDTLKSLVKHSKQFDQHFSKNVLDNLDSLYDKIKDNERTFKDMATDAKTAFADAGEAARGSFEGIASATGLATMAKSAGDMAQLMKSVRMEMDMTDDSAKQYSDAIYASMSRQNASWEEAQALAKKASFFNVAGKDIEAFMSVGAKSTQILEEFGMGADETADFMWSLAEAGIPFEDMPKTIGGMVAASRKGNVAFSETVSKFSEHAKLLKSLGGDAAHTAGIGISAVQNAFGNAWADQSAEAADGLFKMFTDQEAYMDTGNRQLIATIAKNGGASLSDMDALFKKGDYAGATEMFVQALGNLDASMINNIALNPEQIYGANADVIRELVGSQGTILENLRAIGDAGEKAGKSNVFFDEMHDLANSTAWETWRRVWNSGTVIFAKLGAVLEPLLKLLGTIVHGLLSSALWIFEQLGAPIQMVIALLLTAVTAFVAVSAAIATVTAASSTLAGVALTAAWTAFLPIATAVWGALSAVAVAAWAALAPFLPLIAAIAAVVAVGYGLYKMIDWLIGFDVIWSSLGDGVLYVWDLMKAFAGAVGGFIWDLLAPIRLIAKIWWSMVSAIGRMTTKIFVNIWDTIAGGATKAAKWIWSKISGPFLALADIASSVWTGFIGGISKVYKVISGLYNTVTGWFSNIGSTIWNGILSLVQGIMLSAGASLSRLGQGMAGSRFIPTQEMGRFLIESAGHIANAAPNVPALAKGGMVTTPTIALIGEAGPEFVIPADNGAGVQPLDRKSGSNEALKVLKDIRDILRTAVSAQAGHKKRGRRGGLQKAWQM